MVGMNISLLIDNLSQQGRHCFTIGEALQRLDKPRASVRAALRRSVNKGHLTLLHKNFYLIVPPKYRSFGCLPAEQFVPDLMDYLKQPYYVGLLSAAQYYGAAHQKPQQFQVMAKKHLSSLKCGRIHVAFMMNQGILQVPTRKMNTETGYLTVSTPEATAIDLAQYPRRSGGINNIVTVLMELAEHMEAAKLQDCLSEMQVEVVTKQRLGFYLDFIEETALSDIVHEHLSAVALRARPLVAGVSTRKAARNKRWELFINVEIEPDL